MKVCYFLFFIALAITFSSAEEPTGLIMLFRHGARGPSFADFDKTWGNMYGELTGVGVRQEYLRGAYLRKLYPNLFAKYDPNTITIRSTDYNRTIMSVYSMLDGLFESNGPSFPAGYPMNRTYPLYPNSSAINDTDTTVFPFAYQPVPIHTLELPKDELLFSFSATTCPYASYVQHQQYQNTQLTSLWNNQFYYTQDLLRRAVNSTVPLSEEKTHTLYDTMIANYYEGKPLPGGIDPNSELGKNLTFLFSYTTYFVDAGTPYQRQLYSMNPLNQFRADLDSILKGSKQVIRLYSAHDATLVPILAALGIANHECLYKNFFEGANLTSCSFPSYASAIRLEIYKNEVDLNSSTLRFLYNEVPQNICNSSDGNCTWSAFQNLVQNITQGKTVDYWRAQCTQSVVPPPSPDDNNGTRPNPQPSNSNSRLHTALYCLGGVAGVLLVGIIVIYKKKKDSEALADQGL